MSQKQVSLPPVALQHQAGFPGGFAVLMAVYLGDDPILFDMAVSSVLANTLQPSQIAVVADGPLSDDLDLMVERLQHRHPNRLEILRLPENIGLAGALNAGLEHISLPWVIRADADDFNIPERFASLADLLHSQPELQLMGSAIMEVDSQGGALFVREVPTTEPAIRSFARTRNPFNHMTVAYLREVVIACGGYPDVRLKEDYALWCRMLAAGARMANTPKILVHATAGHEMYRRRGGWRNACAEWKLQELMVQCGMKTKSQAWYNGILRGLVYLAPVSARGAVYKTFLRERFVNEGRTEHSENPNV